MFKYGVLIALLSIVILAFVGYPIAAALLSKLACPVIMRSQAIQTISIPRHSRGILIWIRLIPTQLLTGSGAI